MGQVQPNGCEGTCCQGFSIGYTPEQLLDPAVEVTDRYIPERDRATIAQMLVRVGTDGAGRAQYDCTHQAPNGDCGLWGKPERPFMCLAYPNGIACPACGMPDTGA